MSRLRKGVGVLDQLKSAQHRTDRRLVWVPTGFLQAEHRNERMKEVELGRSLCPREKRINGGHIALLRLTVLACLLLRRGTLKMPDAIVIADKLRHIVGLRRSEEHTSELQSLTNL